MKFRGQTVIILMGLTMILSSLVTYIIVGENSPIFQNSTPQLNQTEEKPSTDSKTGKSSKEVADKLSKITEAYDLIRQNYVLEVDEEKLLEGAIEGMLNTLEDPYSVYMNPETAEQFKSSLQSSFEGIGAEVMLQNNRVTIVAPIRNAPAEKAGLRPNDQIISVNGENIEGLDLYQAVLKIRGPKNTKAVLEIARPGVSENITITVVRDEIPIETVYSETINSGGKKFGKIQITSFGASTAEDFAKAFTKFEKNKVDGLVIDVRGNPGGYLDAVREIGKMLVPNEGIITSIQNRDGEKVVYRSTLKEKVKFPITILVDNGSASASEILAAALQEAGNYKVVGKTTFGKGTVQNTVSLKDESEIKITIAKWLTPKDNWIHQKGVKPDVEVDQPAYFHAAPINAEKPLEKEMNNDQVKNLQIILKGLGYDPGREDGFFSAETEMAVKSFQAKNNLPASGKVDEKTASLLQEQLIQVIKDPKNDVQLKKALEVLLEEIR